MQRRNFLNNTLLAGSILPVACASMVMPASAQTAQPKTSRINQVPNGTEPIFIEKHVKGRPHEGKDALIGVTEN